MVIGMTEPVVIRVPDAAVKAAWKKAAEKAGLSLSDYVQLAVAELQAGGPAIAVRAKERQAVAGVIDQQPGPTVRPEDCVRRVRAGSYCRFCGAIHTKGI